MRFLMDNNKITPRPPTIKSVKDFILDAENKKNEIEYTIKQRRQLPWQDQKVRQDVQKFFTVKLPEEYILKIKYLSEYTNKSQQKIVREIISGRIDDMLSDIT